jgi:prolyl-tRNA synthetase
VVRWELRPRMFLRTSEFLWQEGHTAHADAADASAYARRILHEVYEDFMVNVLALPVVVGCKTPSERFAGAINTMTCEAMMGDGKALQMGTSHELGQNFAKAFDITYLDDTGTQQMAWTTSWGVSTRMVGGLIMGHGDDQGLRLPPMLAPVQVVVLAVRDDEAVIDRCRALADELEQAGIRVKLDVDTSSSMGRRVTDWELKGVPVRLELGPRDLEAQEVTMVNRCAGTKTPVALAGVAAAVVDSLAAIQVDMLESARAARQARTTEVSTIDQAVEAAADGWATLGWDQVGEAGERALAAHAMTVRCLVRGDGSVPDSVDEPGLVAVVARSY